MVVEQNCNTAAGAAAQKEKWEQSENCSHFSGLATGLAPIDADRPSAILGENSIRIL